jgi:hypothetical protein
MIDRQQAVAVVGRHRGDDGKNGEPNRTQNAFHCAILL